MTLFDLVAFLGACFGSVSLATSAGTRYGFWGYIGGFLIGIPLGWFLAAFLLTMIFAPLLLFEKFNTRRKLRPFFGKYWGQSQTTSWNSVVSRFALDVHVNCKVVDVIKGGIILDGDIGFPVRFPTYRLLDPTDTTMFARGSAHSGKVIRLDERERMVEVDLEGIESLVRPKTDA